jgi:hypothetical protein
MHRLLRDATSLRLTCLAIGEWIFKEHIRAPIAE